MSDATFVSFTTFKDETHKRMLIIERFAECAPTARDWRLEVFQDAIILFEKHLASGLPIRIMPLPEGEFWMGQPTI